MDTQQNELARIHTILIERYPMYKANPAFEQWLLARTEDDPDSLMRYLDLLDGFQYINGEGVLTGDYTTLPEPDELAGTIRKRLDALGSETRGLLRLASVEGAYFSAEVLGALHGTSHDHVIRLLQPALDLGIVAHDGREPLYSRHSRRYRFVPTQMYEILCRELPEEERRRLHGVIVEYLGAELKRADDPGSREMLGEMLSEHNKSVTRPYQAGRDL